MSKKLIFLTSFLLMLSLVFANVVSGAVVDVRIAAELDDTEEDINPSKLGEVDADSSDLEMPYEDTGMGDPQLIGLRYQVDIPKGATIIDAWVRFQVDELKDGSLPVNLIIEGQLDPNPGEFVDGGPGTFDVSTRPRTAAQVQWSVENWENVGDQGPAQTTTNIASVIQEIVNQDGWAAGNSLVLIITDDPANPSEGNRVAEAGPGDDSALLHVEFATDEPVVVEGPYLQEDSPDGIVSIQAENFHANTPQGDHAWEFMTDVEGFTGTGFMQSLPNNGDNRNTVEDYTTISPRLDYDVFFVTSGIHYVWVHGHRISGSDDSAHVAIDATETGGGEADRMQTGSDDGTWQWSTQRRESLGPAQIEVDGAGVHTISVWMREDGWIFDKIVLTTNPDFVPEGEGPAESGSGTPAGAYGAEPANGAVDVKDAPVLTWIAPVTAFQHDVYLGTDADLVAAGDASVFQGSLNAARFEVDVNTPLERGTTYYWKVDVTTGTSRASELHPGNVWSLRVADENTASWLAAASADAPGYLDTFVEDDLYDIGAFSGDITYEFVVISNPDEQEASMALIGRRQFGDTQAGLKYEQWNNTGTYGATLFGVVDLDYGVPTSPGEYTVLTFVSSEASNTTALYVNGALAGSVDAAITLSGLVGIGYGAQGADMSGSFDNFDGIIFGVAIYDMALTDEQIAAHADAYFNPVTEIIPVDPGTEGLVAYYAFENDVNDNSGNGNVGTIVGDPVFVEGPTGFGTALEFNGDDYVDCGNADSLQIQDAITMSFWFNVVAFENTWEAMLSKGDSAYRVSRGPGTGDATHMGISGTTGGGGAGWFNGVTLVTGGVWHHFAGTYDGAEGRIYIDGVLDATTEATGQINIETENLWIGNNSQNVDRFFHGMMDEVRLYNRALSDLEVMYLAGKRATPVDPGSDGLLGFWPFDEGAGAVVGDASGNGRDGTFVNGDPAWVEGVQGTAVELVAPTLVEIPPLGLELSEATMAGWILPNGPQNDWASIIMTRPPASGFNILGLQLAYHWNDTEDSWSFRGGDMIAEDDWTFAAVTVAPDKATFYVNGDMGSINEVIHEPVIWDVNIYLGGDFTYADTDRKMNGALDEVVMYDRALSAGEIRYIAGFRAMDDVLGPDVTALGDVVQGVPNDGVTTGGGDNGWPANEAPDLAFDDDVTTKYLHFKGEVEPTGLRIEPASGPSVVMGLTLTTANDAVERDPVTFEVYGSNDSIDGPYELIASGDIVDFAQDEAWPRFTMNATPISFSNTVAYTYYQVMFPTVRDPAGANSMQIAEVELRVSKF